MSAAHAYREETAFEALVSEAFGGARQGAVLVVEARDVPAPRLPWLQQLLSTSVPGGAVHLAGEGLLLIVVRHAGPAETWLLVERLRRKLPRSGWERVVVASATWPVQGSSPMDVVAAALASLFDERTRLEQEWSHREVWLEVDGHVGFNWGYAGELLTG
ncbi:MAG: hypothetical protein ACOZQL_04455 [Myxococcota bacterium]